FIVFYSWISSSFPRPPAKRAVALAAINAFSQLGNIAGSYVWDLDADGYRKSYGIVTAMFGVTILGCFCFRVILTRLNRKLEAAEQQGEDDEEWVDADAGAGAGPSKRTADLQAEDVMGDEALRMRKGFRYLV
ncbi:hypothetical protein BD289DRAFT_486566, partial [Coniella lustricola]